MRPRENRDRAHRQPLSGARLRRWEFSRRDPVPEVGCCKKEIQEVPDGLRKILRSGRQQPLRCGYSAGQLRGLPGAALSDVGQGVQSRLQKGGQRGLPPLGAVYSVPQHRLRQRPEPDARGRKPAGYRGAHRFFRMGLCDRLSAPAQRLHLCQADAGR